MKRFPARHGWLLCAALWGCSPDNNGAPDVTQYDPDCDPIMGSGMAPCAMPWPSSLYLKEDPSRKTGYALRFGPTSLPQSHAGMHVQADSLRPLDGYSVGTPLLVRFPNLDVSAMATEDHIERSLVADAQVLWLEVSGDAVKRVPYFVELDSFETDPALQTLFVRPAVILKEATRYVVAFRNLHDTSGMAIPPSRPFVRLRDQDSAAVPVLAARQARFDQVFATLEAQGVPRASLTLAWDFVTASNEALHGDLLHMRDDALMRVGDQGPVLKILPGKITEYASTDDGSGRQVDADIALDVEGTFDVPSYMADWKQPGFTGSRINRDATGLPLPSGTRTAHFWLRIPHSAISGGPHGLVLYGHGLLGSGDQVRGGFNGRIANQNRLIFFAADLFGMASDDAPQVIKILSELSRFPSLGDRLHQGMIEWVLLARAMREQLSTLPELARYHIQVNKDELFYSGISQGGIFGGTFVALSPDVTYGHLGVPGNNYSTLLYRSTDFTMFFLLLQSAYPDPADQAVLLSTMQLSWDATDPVTHFRHLSEDPYPGNKPHYVLLGPARGDHQVAPLTNEILARTGLGVSLMEHYDDQRMPSGITLKPYPHTGSGVVLWHFGNPWPAPGNHPPMDTLEDPHEKPRRNDDHNRQMVNFFRTGQIIDVCKGGTCPSP